MARAEVKFQDIRTIAGVTLDLTLEEAQFIRFVVGKRLVGKGPVREISDSIYRALRDAEVEPTIPGTIDGVITAGV